MQNLLLIVVSAIPIIALSLAIYKAVVKKKQNKSILANIIFIVIISLLILFPAISLFIDGLLFFMVIIAECYILSILIPLSAFVFLVLLVAKKTKLNPTKRKTVVSIVFILLLTVMVCFGIFSGVFIDTMNWIIGGPPIQ